MPISIKDIAKEVGVSHTTVSRALRGSSLISEETTKRVQETAIKLGYFPSTAARSLKTNRSQALGVIVSNIDDPYFSEILQGIEEIAQGNNYSLFMAASQHHKAREAAIAQAMRQHRVDGFIICSTTFSDEQSHQFSMYGIPIVVVNNQAAEEYRYSIYHDDVDGSRQVTRHLLDLGHRKIAYLGNSQSGRTTQDRLAGLRQELDSAGVEISASYIHELPGNEPEKAALAVDYFLRLPTPPSALVCFNDMMAIGVLKKLQERGVQVPDEFSITGFDNIGSINFALPDGSAFNVPETFGPAL